MKRLMVSLLGVFFVLVAGSAAAQELRDPSAPDGLRAGGTASQTLSADSMAGEPKQAGREVLNYPEQPPVIPHTIRDYQVDKRSNRCLTCHSREEAVDAGAPMVSITHFMDRHKQVLAAVSPDRYFCTQCHVPQTDAKPLVENQFRTADEVLIEAIREREGGKP